jgi:hypothetical protein
MRLNVVFCLIATVLALPTPAAPATTKSPKAAPVSINIRTAGDLADSCSVSPDSKLNFARLNFCNGFAQGALQTNGQNPSGTKFCLPSPAPKRSDTMKEFAVWLRANASRRDELASMVFLQFMGGRFPCTKG